VLTGVEAKRLVEPGERPVAGVERPVSMRTAGPPSLVLCEISSEWHGIIHRSGSRICHQMALSRFDAGTSALWLSRSGCLGCT